MFHVQTYLVYFFKKKKTRLDTLSEVGKCTPQEQPKKSNRSLSVATNFTEYAHICTWTHMYTHTYIWWKRWPDLSRNERAGTNMNLVSLWTHYLDHMHMHLCMPAHTCPHACTHTHTHTHTHAHTYRTLCIQSLIHRKECHTTNLYLQSLANYDLKRDLVILILHLRNKTPVLE